MNLAKRSSGILMHITSLPSAYGIGDLGPCSYSFVDLLSKVRQRYWHILPLTPTSLKSGNSPYQPTSAFAGNSLLISPDLLVSDGFLSRDYAETLRLPPGKVNFKAVTTRKNAMLKKAYRSFDGESGASSPDFIEFYVENSEWLDDYALFSALKSKMKTQWYLWPRRIRDRDPEVLKKKNEDLRSLVELEKFVQYVFFGQLKKLKLHCQTRGVGIVGDVPFYVGYDSCDVWVHPDQFKLDKQKRAKFVAGVPPDYFSQSGQLWGNPVYDWPLMESTGFNWWMKRINHSLRFIDDLRLDHFRGFTAYWQVPAKARTAKNGCWNKAAAESFFTILKRRFPVMPFIAEDLGQITKAVQKNLKSSALPGMRVLVFAFDGSATNPNLPVNYIENSVVFTGTHDTNTVRGWFAEETSGEQKKRVYECLGKRVSEGQISREFVKLALASKAKLSLIPIQDVLALGTEARVNCPSRRRHNWEWRVSAEQLADRKVMELGELAQNSNRV